MPSPEQPKKKNRASREKKKGRRRNSLEKEKERERERSGIFTKKNVPSFSAGNAETDRAEGRASFSISQLMQGPRKKTRVEKTAARLPVGREGMACRSRNRPVLFEKGKGRVRTRERGGC